MVVVRRTKLKRKGKGSVKRNDGPFNKAAAEFSQALEDLETYERECAEVLARLAEMKERRDIAGVQLEAAAKTFLRGSRPVRISGLKVYRQERAGKRQVETQILMARYPNIWTHNGVVKINVSAYDKLVASGVVKTDAPEFITRGPATETIHIEVEDKDDG